MKLSKERLADEELAAFLNEIGLSSLPGGGPSGGSGRALGETKVPKKESSLDQLIEEIFELTEVTLSHSSPPPPLPSLKAKEKKWLSFTTPRVMIFIILFWAGFLAGSLFGFIWAKSLKSPPPTVAEQEIGNQISYWIEQLNTLYEKLEDPIAPMVAPTPTPEEAMQLPPQELELF